MCVNEVSRQRIPHPATNRDRRFHIHATSKYRQQTNDEERTDVLDTLFMKSRPSRAEVVVGASRDVEQCDVIPLYPERRVFRHEHQTRVLDPTRRASHSSSRFGTRRASPRVDEKIPPVRPGHLPQRTRSRTYTERLRRDNAAHVGLFCPTTGLARDEDLNRSTRGPPMTTLMPPRGEAEDPVS